MDIKIRSCPRDPCPTCHSAAIMAVVDRLAPLPKPVPSKQRTVDPAMRLVQKVK